MSHETITVQNNKPMPSVGLGYWKVPQSDAAQLTLDAIRFGYRHLDCAADYGNEAQVGDGILASLGQGLCNREDLWVTSKLWNTFHRPEHVRPALEKTLKDLMLDYLDLFLVHFPIALRYVPIEERYPPGWFYATKGEDHRMIPDSVPIRETWQAMEELIDSGLVRSIGVSNFGVSLIRDLLSNCRVRPSVLQVESHPYLVQSKLLRYCQSEKIAYTAFSPLGAPSYIPIQMATAADSVIELPAIRQIAKRTTVRLHKSFCVGAFSAEQQSFPKRIAKSV